jgi:DNA-binding transcriptional ArsR family regulator
MVARRSSTLAGAQADLVFHALSDGTRRDILKRAAGEEHSVSELASGYKMSFAAVQKHVAVLERAELVTKRHVGRRQLVLTNIHTLQAASGALSQLEKLWRQRMIRFGDVLAESSKGDKK